MWRSIIWRRRLSGEIIKTLTPSGAAHVAENGPSQESGTADPLESFGDHDAENVALQRSFLKESVPAEPVGSQGITSCAGTHHCRLCGRQNGVGKTSDLVTRKCTFCDQEIRRDVTSRVRREPQQRSLKSFFAPSVAATADCSVGNPAAVASPSDMGSGPPDFDSGASSVLRLLEGKTVWTRQWEHLFRPVQRR